MTLPSLVTLLSSVTDEPGHTALSLVTMPVLVTLLSLVTLPVLVALPSLVTLQSLEAQPARGRQSAAADDGREADSGFSKAGCL